MYTHIVLLIVLGETYCGNFLHQMKILINMNISYSDHES